MTIRRHIDIADDLTITLYKDQTSSIVMLQSQKSENHVIQVTKEEAFKLAYALMSLASEL